MVSGPACVGKSTIAQGVAESFPLNAVLHGDDFLDSIVQGWVEPWLPESASQNEVLGAAFAVAAMAFAAGGYAAVIDGHLFPDGVDGLAAACRARGLHPGFADLHDRYGDLGRYEGHAVDASGDPEEVTAEVLAAYRSGRLVTG